MDIHPLLTAMIWNRSGWISIYLFIIYAWEGPTHLAYKCYIQWGGGAGYLVGGTKTRIQMEGKEQIRKRGYTQLVRGPWLRGGWGLWSIKMLWGNILTPSNLAVTSIDIILCTIFNINIIHINELINYFVYLLCKEPLASCCSIMLMITYVIFLKCQQDGVSLR